MKKSIFIFSLAGMLFAGYLSYVRFFSNHCAFSEGCPYFLGYPACYYGFAVFTLLTIISMLGILDIFKRNVTRILISCISFLGILFSGYFTLKELPTFFEKGIQAYFFGLPTCALGLIFYVAVFALNLHTAKQKKSPQGNLGL